MKKHDVAIILIWIIVAILLAASKANAQDTVYTFFSPTCIEALSPVHYRLHFGYVSSGVETFTVDTVASVSIGNMVTTEQGTHELGYLDAYSPDSAKDFTVTFTGANDSSTIHLNTWDITTPCEVSSVFPDATPEPTPDTEIYGCPAWAVDGKTAEMVCLWSLPKVGSQ
jgi:hypothetical protein